MMRNPVRHFSPEKIISILNADCKMDTVKLLDEIIRERKLINPYHRIFLRRSFSTLVNDRKSVKTALFNPTEFLGKDWKTWRGPVSGDGLVGDEDVDLRSMAFSEIDISRFIFFTGLGLMERSIRGEEKLYRLKEKYPDFIRFGGNVFMGLWLDYQANKAGSILEWLYKNFGVSYMEFLGQILCYYSNGSYRPPNNRCILALFRCDTNRWSWMYYHLRFNTNGNCFPAAGCVDWS